MEFDLYSLFLLTGAFSVSYGFTKSVVQKLAPEPSEALVDRVLRSILACFVISLLVFTYAQVIERFPAATTSDLFGSGVVLFLIQGLMFGIPLILGYWSGLIIGNIGVAISNPWRPRRE